MIEEIAGFLQKNLIVCVAVVVLPLKWAVVRICGDKEAEGAAVIGVPEDLCYVALGLVLGDVINSKGAFRNHFQASATIDLDLFVTVGAGLFVARSIHLLSQWSMRHFRAWRATVKASNSDEGKSIQNSEDNFLTLKIRHLFLFLFVYAIQLTAVLFWIRWIAKVINQTPQA